MTFMSECPSCGRSIVWSTDNPHRPFCSARCKDEDLRRWLVGAYRIPGDPAAEPDDEAPGRAEEQS